jgi:hypothetical protein
MFEASSGIKQVKCIEEQLWRKFSHLCRYWCCTSPCNPSYLIRNQLCVRRELVETEMLATGGDGIRRIQRARIKKVVTMQNSEFNKWGLLIDKSKLTVSKTMQ